MSRGFTVSLISCLITSIFKLKILNFNCDLNRMINAKLKPPSSQCILIFVKWLWFCQPYNKIFVLNI